MPNADLSHLSWVLDDLLKVANTRFAVLFSSDGLLMAKSSNFDKDHADKAAAVMSGLQSLSRAVEKPLLEQKDSWRQTLVEFHSGWVFLSAAGNDSFLAVSTERSVDMGFISQRIQEAAGDFRKKLAALPRKEVGADA